MRREFYEVQKFNQWWLWLLLIAIAIIPFYGIYKQVIIGEQFGDKPMSNSGLVVFAIFTIVFLLFFGLLRLETEINKYEIKFNFFPFIKRKIKWEDVKNVKLINYGFVGYGVRLSKFGKVYNTGGKMGLLIELNKGKSFVIGTQKESQLKEYLESKPSKQLQ